MNSMVNIASCPSMHPFLKILVSIRANRTSGSQAFPWCRMIYLSWSKVCPTQTSNSLCIIIYTFFFTVRNECIIQSEPLVTPCVNGWCVDGLNRYLCICFEGYTGINCDEIGKLRIVPVCMHVYTYVLACQLLHK